MAPAFGNLPQGLEVFSCTSLVPIYGGSSRRKRPLVTQMRHSPTVEDSLALARTETHNYENVPHYELAMESCSNCRPAAVVAPRTSAGAQLGPGRVRPVVRAHEPLERHAGNQHYLEQR